MGSWFASVFGSLEIFHIGFTNTGRIPNPLVVLLNPVIAKNPQQQYTFSMQDLSVDPIFSIQDLSHVIFSLHPTSSFLCKIYPAPPSFLCKIYPAPPSFLCKIYPAPPFFLCKIYPTPSFLCLIYPSPPSFLCKIYPMPPSFTRRHLFCARLI